MPKRPNDISEECWRGLCDECHDDCACDHHLVAANVWLAGDWTEAEVAKIEALAAQKVEMLRDLVD